MRTTSTPTSYSEQQLIEGWKANDLSFDKLYDYFAPAFNGDIKRALVNENVSVETLNKVFVELFKSIDSFDPAKERFFTWAIKVVRREIRARKTEILIKDLFLCQQKDRLEQPVKD